MLCQSVLILRHGQNMDSFISGSIDEDAMCVAMTATHPIGLWETKNCTFEKSYICEYPREGYTTPSTTTTTIAPVFCPSTWLEFNGYCYKVD